MAGRTTRMSVTFSSPFSLVDVDGIQPAGTYRVQTVEVSLDTLSFLAYRRVSTTIELPGVGTASSRRQVVTIDPLDLDAALQRDRSGSLTAARQDGSKTAQGNGRSGQGDGKLSGSSVLTPAAVGYH